MKICDRVLFKKVNLLKKLPLPLVNVTHSRKYGI
jgi:hypothetical protein